MWQREGAYVLAQWYCWLQERHEVTKITFDWPYGRSLYLNPPGEFQHFQQWSKQKQLEHNSSRRLTRYPISAEHSKVYPGMSRFYILVIISRFFIFIQSKSSKLCCSLPLYWYSIVKPSTISICQSKQKHPSLKIPEAHQRESQSWQVGCNWFFHFFAIKFLGLWIELDLQFRDDLKHSCGVDGFLGNALHGNSASTSTDLCSAWRSSSNFTKNQACWWKASGLQRKWGAQEQIKVQDHHSSWLWELQRNEFPCTPSTHLNLSNLNHSLVFILKFLQIKLAWWDIIVGEWMRDMWKLVW